MNQSKKTILVTGGAGFLGVNLCQKLLNLGHKVICLDNFATSTESNIKTLQNNPNFSFFKFDVVQEFNFGKFDEIYHLASPASPPRYQKDPIATFRTNIWGTYNCLQLAQKYSAKFLLASTSEVYGDPLVHPQPESYWGNVNPIGIRSNYDESKRASESLTMGFWRMHQTKVRIIRIFNTYGPFMDPNDGRVVSNFIVQALQNKPLTIYGDGSQTRSFQYVSDLVEGMILMMENTDNFVGPVNLGNPVEFSVLELANLVLQLIPESSSKIEFLPLPQDDPKVRKPDITLAKNKLKWEPKVSLQQGLSKTIEYFRSIL